MVTSKKATSTELTGGTGFTYEDTVVAYYLTALLRGDRASGQRGTVISVAVQQSGNDHPMDDLVIEYDDHAGRRSLALQVKRSIRITANNEDFKQVMAAAVATRGSSHFDEHYVYGFVTEHVALDRYRALDRIIKWAKASPFPADFERRFATGGAAAANEQSLRDELKPLTGAATTDEEIAFYRQFFALKMEGLEEAGVLRMEQINRLQEIVQSNDDGLDVLLFDRLCRLARDAAGTAQKWTRATLLAQLRGLVKLRVSANYRQDVQLLTLFSKEGLEDIAESIDELHVGRPALTEMVQAKLCQTRLVNITGLPGCGKSVVLRQFAASFIRNGPILFLKSDRLMGTGWSTFAAALGIAHSLGELLTEIGASGTPTLFIDGIDRVRPDQKGLITDILREIESNVTFENWRVVATSRDQGLEPFRAWFPSTFYRGTGIGDVTVGPFSDEEAESLATQKPQLRRLLFGTPNVREIARRPFFLAVLAHSLPDSAAMPQTEIDLISEWWIRAGHDALPEKAPQRQRALLNLAEAGVRTLGKNIAAQDLKDATFDHIATLKSDHVIRERDLGAAYSFSHDIFFEWTFFRLLIELGDNWHRVVADAGEPPLLGRVVALLAQDSLTTKGEWTAGYRALENCALRPQWRREWLTAPPFTTLFALRADEFTQLLAENDFALLEKVLVWFQAQHTVPNPFVLQRLHDPLEGYDNLRMADMLGWPSDFQSWARLLDWLIALSVTLPPRLVPHVVEVFGVWQNALADVTTPQSIAILDRCSEWLIDLENTAYSSYPKQTASPWHGIGSEGRSSLVSSLRMMLMRAARSNPSYAIALFDRAIENNRMRDAAFSDLMTFTTIMAEVAPDKVVSVVKAALLNELPKDRKDRENREKEEYFENLRILRAIPESDQTPEQRRYLDHVHFPRDSDRHDLDDIGIARHNSFFFPVSAVHEPFAGLFAKAPTYALALIRDLANHATKGWRQLQDLDRRRMGTPIPAMLEFPWGRQEFWGDWHVYNWFLGQLAPQPLECAFLALSHWAFKEIEGGRSVSEVVRSIVEGSECYAVLGLALVLTLENWEVSEVTLPIVCCQKLWHHDMARFVHEPTRNVDLFGLGLVTRLTGEKAKAKQFLDERKSRKREVRDIAALFAFSSDERIRMQFEAALADFPTKLPYDVEEQQSNAKVTESLREKAERWAGLGDKENYEQSPAGNHQVMITYQPPIPLSQGQEKRLAESVTHLSEQQRFNWATKSLAENKPADGWSLAEAITFAMDRDSSTLFEVRLDVGGHALQSAVSAIAACAIRFTSNQRDHEWAWGVMERVHRMREPDGFSGSKIPWHPAIHLVVGLFHDRQQETPRSESSTRLLELTVYPLDDIAELAFQALFKDRDEHVRWVTAQLAMDLSFHWRPTFGPRGEGDHSVSSAARKSSLDRALKNVGRKTVTPLTQVPPAWIKSTDGRHRRRDTDEETWCDPEPQFDAQYAAKIFPNFPVEVWCQATEHSALWEAALKELVSWTAERLMPSWDDRKRHRDVSTELIEWKRSLGDLLARSAPFLETQLVREILLAPFLADDDEALGVLAEFTDKSVSRHVLDAKIIPRNTLELLSDCADRILRDRAFNPNGYRAGQVHGHDLPEMIKALFLVNVEHAPGAARFVNGDWSQLQIMLPITTRMVAAIGWSPFVMQNFLTLCERAGHHYPIDEFGRQILSAFEGLPKAKQSWIGTLLPSRIAALIQRLTDANFPLQSVQAQSILKILDALIDLGDRRSAALEQTEAFRNVQIGPTSRSGSASI